MCEKCREFENENAILRQIIDRSASVDEFVDDLRQLHELATSDITGGSDTKLKMVENYLDQLIDLWQRHGTSHFDEDGGLRPLSSSRTRNGH